jgi:hypothetical protein
MPEAASVADDVILEASETLLVQVSHILKGVLLQNEVGLDAGIWYIWGVNNP